MGTGALGWGDACLVGLMATLRESGGEKRTIWWRKLVVVVEERYFNKQLALYNPSVYLCRVIIKNLRKKVKEINSYIW